MDVLSNIRNGVYKSKIPYPEPVWKPEILSKKVGNLTAEEILCIPKIMKEYQDALDNHKNTYNLIREENGKLENQFWRDIAEEFGVTNNPKKNMLMEIAYDMGHSAGYDEIYSYYSQLVELIK